MKHRLEILVKSRLKSLKSRLKFLIRPFLCLGLAALLGVSSASASSGVVEQPVPAIQSTIDSILVSFSTERKQLENNRQQLFDLVDRIASPMFDFEYIAKLILGTNWKTATGQQRREFAYEIKRLLIATYATALFLYTGDETIAFEETSIKQRKSINFATVHGYFRSADDRKFDMVYSLMQKPGDKWKIYNLTVADLNVVLNYRNVVQSIILKDGIEGTIALMKTNNDKSYNR